MIFLHQPRLCISIPISLLQDFFSNRSFSPLLNYSYLYPVHQSPDLHHSFSPIFIYVLSLFGTDTWLFPSQPCYLTHFLLYFFPSYLWVTEICMCHVCQQTFCTNFNSRIFPNYSSAPCPAMKLCFCNNLLQAKLHPHPSLPASLL